LHNAQFWLQYFFSHGFSPKFPQEVVVVVGIVTSCSIAPLITPAMPLFEDGVISFAFEAVVDAGVMSFELPVLLTRTVVAPFGVQEIPSGYNFAEIVYVVSTLGELNSHLPLNGMSDEV
jgi:hypothetical protein